MSLPRLSRLEFFGQDICELQCLPLLIEELYFGAQEDVGFEPGDVDFEMAEALAVLKTLPKLRTLWIPDVYITTGSLRHISKIPSLTVLLNKLVGIDSGDPEDCWSRLDEEDPNWRSILHSTLKLRGMPSCLSTEKRTQSMMCNRLMQCRFSWGKSSSLNYCDGAHSCPVTTPCRRAKN